MAHDGSDWGLMEKAARAAPPPTNVLVARCLSAPCGAQSAFDIAEWLGTANELPLRAFEARLRCTCGARRVRLEPAAGEPPPVNPAIYRFR